MQCRYTPSSGVAHSYLNVAGCSEIGASPGSCVRCLCACSPWRLPLFARPRARCLAVSVKLVCWVLTLREWSMMALHPTL